MRSLNSVSSSKGGLIIEACLLILFICIASAGTIRFIGLKTNTKYESASNGFDQAEALSPAEIAN